MSRKRKKNRSKLPMAIYRWHYRIGLVMAFFLLVVIVTGILLNHNADMNLHRVTLDWPWLLEWYGISHSEQGSEWQETISIDRLLLDIHTGKIFGIPGRYMMDLVAIALLWLLGSGIYSWVRRVKIW